MTGRRGKRSDSTKVNIAERVHVAFKMLMAGATVREIHEQGERMGWNVSYQMVKRYARYAREMIEHEAQYQREYEFGQARARLNHLFSQALKVMDFKTCLAVQKELNALMSLYEPPAPQTVQVLNVDFDTAQKLQRALEERGLSASDVFNAMLKQLSEPDVN
jgi:hypothetical protein